MPLDQHVFLARQDASSQQVDDLTAEFKTIVEEAGGKSPRPNIGARNPVRSHEQEPQGSFHADES